MKTLTIALAALFVIATLSACKEQTDRTQAEINKGNPEGQQSRKKVEAALKSGEDQRRKAID